MCVLTPTKTRPSVRDDFFLSLSVCSVQKRDLCGWEGCYSKRKRRRKNNLLLSSRLDRAWDWCDVSFQIQSSPWVANGREEKKKKREIDFRPPTHLSSEDRLLTGIVQCCQEDYSRTRVITLSWLSAMSGQRTSSVPLEENDSVSYSIWERCTFIDEK